MLHSNPLQPLCLFCVPLPQLQQDFAPKVHACDFRGLPRSYWDHLPTGECLGVQVSLIGLLVQECESNPLPQGRGGPLRGSWQPELPSLGLVPSPSMSDFSPRFLLGVLP